MNRRLAIILLGVISIVLLAFSDVLPSKVVKIWVFDIGQGDAIFIDGPDKQVLIDGGPDALVLERLSSVMPWWDRSIDMVVNTHPHADHLIGLLSVLERYKVNEVLDGDEGYNTPEFQEYLRLAPRRAISNSEVIELGRGARLTTLWPLKSYDQAVIADPNDGSIVFLFEYGETSMLLTGDAGIDEEVEWEIDDIDILKVGHHGSDTSTSRELIDRTHPEVAIISVGAGNDYGHPSTFVIDRLLRAGSTVLRTDFAGSISIKTRGAEPTTRAYRF